MSNSAAILLRRVIIVLGAITIIVALTADLTQKKTFFGPSQILLIILGCLLVIGGTIHRFFPKAIRSILLVSSLCCALIAAEVLANIYIRITHKDVQSQKNDLYSAFKQVPDPELGFRLEPNTPGHDARGFRNLTALKEADVVAIGDSQTWGSNVPLKGTWPVLLSGQIHRTVYSYALGGYGPVQYSKLMRDAIALNPKIIVVAIYMGNDFWDSYHAVYQSNLMSGFPKRPDLMMDTIGTKATALSKNEPQTVMPSNQSDGLFGFFSRTSLGGLVRNLPIFADEKNIQDWKKKAEESPDRYSIFENGKNPTAFTPAYRLLALDLNEPRIAQGLSIAENMLKRMQDLASENHCRLLIALIPTKESAYSRTLHDHGVKTGTVYNDLFEMESKARGELLQYCLQNRIDCLDLLPELSRRIASGERLYPSNGDGHPIRKGYQAIAKAVAKELELRKWI